MGIQAPTIRRTAAIVVAVAAVVWVAVRSWAGAPVTVNSLGQMVMFALPIAGIYAVQATGLVVVYASTGIFNLAQGSIGMVGAFVYWTLLVQWHIPEALSLILAVFVFAPVFGLLLDAAIMRRLARASLIVKLTATLGLSLTLLGFANVIWNPDAAHAIPNLVAQGGISAFGVVLTWQDVITIGTALALALVLRWLLYRTRTGISMRAIVDNSDLATLFGIRNARVSGLAWILGSVCATAASILIAPELGNLSGQTLMLLIIDSFAAAAVGRLRSLPMTYLGALLLGLVVSFSSTFLQFGGQWAQVPTVIPSIALLVVLLFLPEAAVHVGRALRTYRMESVPSWRTVGIASAIVLVAAIAVGPVLSAGTMVQIATAVATGVILLGMVPLLGWAGLPFLAPYGLAGFGAWLAWRLQPDMPDLVAILVAGLVTAVVGVVATIPALRLRGLYLALGTIAFANIAVTLIFPLPALLEADHAVSPLVVFGLNLNSASSFVIFATIVYLLLAACVVWLRRSRFGRRLIAMRESEAATACVGISLVETKAIVFMIAGFVAGVGGALLVYAQQFVSVDQLPLIGGLSIVLSLVVFGVGTVSGPLVAGLMAAAFAIVSTNWLQGNWGDTLTVVGPALAALGLINLPRGAVPEVVADAKDHPWALLARVAGLVAGAAIGIACQVPGLVGVGLAVVGAVAGGVLADAYSGYRKGALDALAWPERVASRASDASSAASDGSGAFDGSGATDDSRAFVGSGATDDSGGAGIDDPSLGLSGEIDDIVRGQLDAALGISTAGVR
jgi:branched-chain amino acid transport system permease protein